MSFNISFLFTKRKTLKVYNKKANTKTTNKSIYVKFQIQTFLILLNLFKTKL
jgi:hypothetical protein